jgi:hypothetical protein
MFKEFPKIFRQSPNQNLQDLIVILLIGFVIFLIALFLIIIIVSFFSKRLIKLWLINKLKYDLIYTQKAHILSELTGQFNQLSKDISGFHDRFLQASEPEEIKKLSFRPDLHLEDVRRFFYSKRLFLQEKRKSREDYLDYIQKNLSLIENNLIILFELLDKYLELIKTFETFAEQISNEENYKVRFLQQETGKAIKAYQAKIDSLFKEMDNSNQKCIIILTKKFDELMNLKL